VGLPPDLARLGDHLVDAARRATRERRAQRRRFALAALTGALAFAALTPAALGPAHRELRLAAVPAEAVPAGCDQPRGVRFTLVSCGGPMVLNRPYAIQ
jgi:hypothetical protein